MQPKLSHPLTALELDRILCTCGSGVNRPLNADLNHSSLCNRRPGVVAMMMDDRIRAEVEQILEHRTKDLLDEVDSLKRQISSLARENQRSVQRAEAAEARVEATRELKQTLKRERRTHREVLRRIIERGLDAPECPTCLAWPETVASLSAIHQDLSEAVASAEQSISSARALLDGMTD